MPSTSDALEDQLRTDLRALDRAVLADDDLARQIYRALTNRRWRRPGSEEAVALSWGQAEALVNTLREEQGLRPLALAGTGGEGWLSDAVTDALQGWTSEPVLAAASERVRPWGGDSAAGAPLGARRFARRTLRSSSAELMRSRRTHGGPPSQATA